MSSIPALGTNDSAAHPHHEMSDVCPLCDQPIAAEQRAEIWERITMRRRREDASRAAEEKKRTAEAVKSATAEQGRTHAELTNQLREELRAKEEQAKAREEQARQQGRHDAQVAHQQALQQVQAKQAEAEGQNKALAQQLEDTKSAHAKELKKAVALEGTKVRDILVKDKDEALSKQASAFFDEKQKLQSKLQEAQRQLAKERADHLGEGQEVDLYNELKRVFPSDKITRIGKGEPGADIRHEIVERGKACGTLLYESKNSMQWRNGYAAKLRRDQMAAKADHAILASVTFPEGSRELTIVDGVVVVNPRRAVIVAKLLRESTVRIHKMHLSTTQTDAKRDELYKFITSHRCQQMLDREDEMTGELLELEKTEQKQHEKIWKTRGAMLKQLEKVQTEFRGEVTFLIEGET
jgi:hypothetical protein